MGSLKLGLYALTLELAAWGGGLRLASEMASARAFLSTTWPRPAVRSTNMKLMAPPYRSFQALPIAL